MEQPTPPAILFLRLLRIGLHLLQGVVTAAAILPFAREPLRSRIIRAWAAKLLIIFNVEARVKGKAPTLATRGVMFVSNHVSWMDVWLLLSVRPVRFISKADVRAWPVVGYLAEKAGTLFIQRERRHHTAAIVGQAEAVLAQGDCLALFPEGTTTNGLRLRAFHPSLFQVAVDHAGAIALVTIRYVFEDGRIDTAPAYADEITLAESMRAILARRKIIAEVHYFDTLDARGKTRRALASEAEAAIAKALNLPIPHKASGKPAGLPSESQTKPLPTDSPYPAPHDGSPP